MLRLAPFWIFLLTLVPLQGQTAVEAALGASRAATTTAPAQGLAKALGGLLGGLDKSLSAATAPATAAVAVPPEKLASPKADGKTYEDPKRIQSGLTYDELLQRFGPPAMELTTAPSRRSLMYAGKDGVTTRIELQDGKVLAPDTSKAKPAPPEQSSVIVLK